MKFWGRIFSGVIVLSAAAIAAVGQTSPISRTIPVTFTGIVTNPISDTIQIRQPDGTFVKYAGPVPDYPYAPGQEVIISFDAVIPTKAYYETGVYQGQVAADGIYRIKVSTQPGSNLIGNIGQASASQVSGPLSAAPNFGEPSFSAITLVYDINTDGYSIEGGGNFAAGRFWGAGFTYDPATGLLAACTTSDCVKPGENAEFDLFADGTGTLVTSKDIRIYSVSDAPKDPNDPNSGAPTGKFNLSFAGSWNLPQFSGSTPVPEPGMILIFALAIGLLLSRRYSRSAKYSAG